MFTSNPFAELSATVSPGLMQAYVVVMILLVAGGTLYDIEFLVDYWVLSRSAEFSDLVEFPDNVRQLEALVRNDLVSAEQADRVRSIYLALRASAHELALIESDRVIPAGAFAEERAWITNLWDEVLGG